MDQIVINLIIVFLLLIGIILIHYYGSNYETFNFAPLPYFYYPLLSNFSSQPSGYDSATRSYYNPNFAIEVAQGLDTN